MIESRKYRAAIAPPGGRTYPALLTLGAAIIALLLTSVASAQNVAGNDGRGIVTDKVIISNMPRKKSRIYGVLSRVLGKGKGEKLGVTQSEVWSIPKSRIRRLSLRLKQLGAKVTHLREDWNHILKRQRGPVVLSASQANMLKKTRSTPEIVGLGMMKVPEAAIAEYALTGRHRKSTPAGSRHPDYTISRIVLPLNDTQHLTIQRINAVTTAKGTTWRGLIEETGESALLMWWKDGHLSGVLGFKGRIYTIVNMGGEVHAVLEIDPKRMPPDHAPTSADIARLRNDRVAMNLKTPTKSPSPPAPSDIKPLSDAQRLVLEAKKVTIDLMILYTKKAASRYIRDPAELAELAVDQANESFRNSGLKNIRLRLVHTQLIDYDDTGGEHFDHLYRMVDGLGPFKDIRRLRNEKRADVVGLIVEDPTGCGLSTRIAPDPEEAYFVVHHSCATITVSIAHEVGHILGARHDRRIDPSNSPFPYGHGYVNGSKWRDIMSYLEGCGGCPRIPFWSNPRINYKGEPTGTVAEDNARVILEQAERVSKFR